MYGNFVCASVRCVILTDDATISQQTSETLRMKRINVSYKLKYLAIAENGGLCYTHNANVLVDRVDATTGILFVQWATNDFLHSQNNTILAAQTNQCAALLNCFASIIDLENTTVRRELRCR